MSSHPKAGERFYHQRLRDKYKGNNEKLLNELAYWGIVPHTGRGSFNANLKALHTFKYEHPITTFENYENMKGQVYDFTVMSKLEKRAFARNFKEFASSLPYGKQMRLKLFIRDPVTGRLLNELGDYISFGYDGITPESFLSMMNRKGDFIITQENDITEETPFKQYELEEYIIEAIEIDCYDVASHGRRGAEAFPFLLIDDTLDLSRYQIYSKIEDIDETPCFVYALRQSAIDRSTLASIEKDVASIKRIEFTAIKMLAEKYKLNIVITQVYVQEDKTIETCKYKCLSGGDAEIINLACMFGHYFINDFVKLNTYFFKFINDERLDWSKRELVWKSNGSRLRYFKSLDDKYVPEAYIYQHIAELNRLNAFKPLKQKLRKKLVSKSVKKELKPYSFERINDSDFELYDKESEWFPSRIYKSMKRLYKISGNVYNIVKNTERAGKYLFNSKAHITERLVCLDVRSMYPYVIVIIGVQLGLCELMPLDSNPFDYSSAFMLIEITAIKRHRKFDVIEGLHLGTYWVRLIELKDLIEFNEIEYKLIGGIGWRDERSHALNSYIDELYAKKESASSDEERLKAKLALNKELYGYSLVKPKTTYKQVMSTEKFEHLLSLDYYKVLSGAYKNDGTVEATLWKRITNSYNMANFGVEISAYARHVLHEYIYKCEDNDIDVFFGFTDSFYIRESDLERFKTLFPNAIGRKLGQLKIEKTIEEAYFFKKSIYALKLIDGSYVFSVPDDHRKIDEFGHEAYWKRFESMFEADKFKRL